MIEILITQSEQILQYWSTLNVFGSTQSQVRTTSPFQWVLLTERDYIVPFNELQHPFSELFQEDGRQVSINYS